MSKKKGTLFVHVGIPRTGSTTIRHALKQMDPELRKRGVLVPATGQAKGIWSHAGLVTLLSGQWHFEDTEADAWQALEREIAASGASTVVLSTAMFTSHGIHTTTTGEQAAQQVEALADACGLEVRIVGYVRRQAELVEAT